MRTLFVVLSLGLLGSCNYDDTFSTCPLSKATRAACESSGGSQLSCVVREHPQCSQDICLSWKGGEAHCTLPCTEKGLECPSGSTCVPYTEGAEVQTEFFCVENQFLRPTDSITVAK